MTSAHLIHSSQALILSQTGTWRAGTKRHRRKCTAHGICQAWNTLLTQSDHLKVAWAVSAFSGDVGAALTAAAESRREDVCLLLCNTLTSDKPERDTAAQVLLLAVKCGDLELAKAVCERAGADADECGSGRPLRGAIRADNLDMCRLLLELGAQPTREALEIAAYYGSFAICQLFLQHKAVCAGTQALKMAEYYEIMTDGDASDLKQLLRDHGGTE